MSNITALPLNGFAPDNSAIVVHLREIAGWIEAGDCDLARAIGILNIAAARAAIGGE